MTDARQPSFRMLDIARDKQLLPQHVLPLIADLRSLRNQAVHGRDFSVDAAQALEYIDLAERIIAALPPRKADE